jgi:hypothetical protein
VGGPSEFFQNQLAVSASPGFTWGRSGNVTNSTWLLNDTVPSNKAGRTVSLSAPSITQVFVASEDVDTYDINIYEHEGAEVNLTLLTTVNIVAARTATFNIDVPMTSGRQLAVRVVNGSAKNIVVGTQLAGGI